jgi:transposase
MMKCYVGLDASLEKTSICVVDEAGKVLCEGIVDSEPEAIAKFLRSKARGAVRIGIETGSTSIWLTTEIRALGFPVICIDARHAKAVLKMQINKSDCNDAVGIARIMQCGWFKEIRIKGFDSHAVRALLASRGLLVTMKRDLENQIRGLLKIAGLLVGTARGNAFPTRVQELAKQCRELAVSVLPLLSAREAIDKQLSELDRKVSRLARADRQTRSFMTAPGVGPGQFAEAERVAAKMIMRSGSTSIPDTTRPAGTVGR